MDSVIRGGVRIVVEKGSQLAERRLCRCNNILYKKCLGGGSRYRWEDVLTKTARAGGTN